MLQQPAEFQRDLLAWYRENRRRLPWREQSSLYRTVVSEFMAQQTQIKTMLPYFARWMEALPDFESLAAAEEASVLKLWEGLGYYSRARNLHRLAQAYLALPEPPQTVDAWKALPGIGPYTAAAITSIALGVPAACVDGNVVRILSRLTADATPYRDSASAAKAFTPLAESLINHDHPGDHNQAMMELGATICHRRSPLCTVCPVRTHCAGCASGAPEEYPQLAAKPIEQVAVTRAWCIRDGALLLHRAGASSRRLANLHELPDATKLGLSSIEIDRAPVLAVKKRGITRYAFTETIKDLSCSPEIAHGQVELVWVPLSQLGSVTVSGPHRRWITALLGGAA